MKTNLAKMNDWITGPLLALLMIVVSMLHGQTQAAANKVIEYYSSGRNHYYITISSSEASGLDANSPPGWSRTGDSFPGYLSNIGAPESAVPVYRFYYAPFDTYFYTAFSSDYALLVSQNPSNDPNVGWMLQGVAFYTPPTLTGSYDGGCAAGQIPVRRFYNQDLASGNHRFSTDPSITASMVAAGWLNEGIVFCAYDVETASTAPLLIPGNIDFVSQAVGHASREQVVTLRNTYLTPLVLGTIAVASPFAVTHHCPATLAPNQSCTISLIYHPTTSGASASQLTVNATTVGLPVLETIPVRGYGVPSLSSGTPSDNNAGFEPGDSGGGPKDAGDNDDGEGASGADGENNCQAPDIRKNSSLDDEPDFCQMEDWSVYSPVQEYCRRPLDTTYVTSTPYNDPWSYPSNYPYQPSDPGYYPVTIPNEPDDVGDPVHLATGSEHLRQVDFVEHGRSMLQFVRTYESAPFASHAFTTQNIGRHWRSNYDRSVVISSDGQTAYAYRGDGKSYRFTKAAGVWNSDSGVLSSLQQTQDGKGTFSGWRYQDRYGNVESYNVEGRLVSLTRHDGTQLALTYSPLGLLIRVQHDNGQAIRFSYNASGQMTTLADPANRNFVYSYDTRGNLQSVTYPDGGMRSFFYEDARYPYALTGATNAAGVRISTMNYDNVGRVIKVTGPGGAQTTTITYEADGSVTTVDWAGNKRVRTFVTVQGRREMVSRQIVCDDCAPMANQVERDANGFVTGVTNANGVITRYAYTTQGFMAEKTEAAGSSLERSTRITWDSTLRKPTRIDLPDGRRLEHTFDTNGRKLSSTLRGSDGSSTRAVKYTYHANGLLAKVENVGPISQKLGFTYNNLGLPITITNASGQITHHEYDALGRRIKTTTPAGLVTTWTYDHTGRVVQTVTPNGTNNNAYDLSGRLVQSAATNGDTYTYSYGADLNLIETRDQRGNTIRFSNDAFGRVTEVEVANGADSFFKRMLTYDARGRLVRNASPAGIKAEYEHDNMGAVTRIKDALARSTALAYDALGRPASITDPLGNSIRIDYDAADRLLRFTDARNNATTFAYGSLGDPLSETSPERGTRTRTVNHAGFTETARDGRGAMSESSFRYDAAGRIIGVTHRDRTGVTWVYDSAVNGVGQLARVTDATGSTAYEYDSNGRVSQKQVSITGRSFVSRYTYDTSGRLTEVTLPSGSKVVYVYALLPDNRLAAITLNGNPLISNISYGAGGAISGWDYGNGQAYRRTFDSEGRLVSHSLPFLNGGISSIGTRSLTYDAAGQIASLNDSNGGSQQFTYDAAGRLASYSASGGLFGQIPGLPTSQRYVYDASGNRTTLVTTGDPLARNNGTTSYTLAQDSNRLLAIAPPSAAASGSSTGIRRINHDTAGNIIHDGLHWYSYDASNRMATSRKDERETIYGYNALGQRVIKTRGGMAEWSHYDDQGRLIRVESSANANAQEYLYLGLQPIAMISIDKHCQAGQVNNPVACATPVITYFWADHLGSPKRATNTSGSIVWSWESAPFGETQAQVDPANTGNKTVINLRFPGQQYDEETGLHYNQMRDYDPSTGRYVQADPIGLNGGPNVFTYVDGKPLTAIDSNGTCATTVSGCIETCISTLNPWLAGLAVTAVAGGYEIYDARTGARAVWTAEELGRYRTCQSISRGVGAVATAWTAGTAFGCLAVCAGDSCSYEGFKK